MKCTRRIVLSAMICAGGLRSLICQQLFEVNLNDRSHDTFKVSLLPGALSDSNNVFQFAATAPGTYEVMDIGRFVDDFKAFDQSGGEVPTEHSSTNQWTITRPSTVRKITYTVADLWGATPKEHPVYRMCGSTLSDDFVMINGQAVFGYFKGLQSQPIRIKLDYPSDWRVGTALKQDRDGTYLAEDFDQVVDSPFFLGNLTTATATIGGATIGVYTYSQTGVVTSDRLLEYLKPILRAESDFTRGLPVDRYAFLFYFGRADAGAWEHSYSSEYVSKERPLTPGFVGGIVTIVSHEFFHVNIPLHVHSELVEHFNFVKPVGSQHLWLYEGTTEWAANILQLRDSLITLSRYLQALQEELRENDGFIPNLSLTSLGVHATELPDQYSNIYNKGAVVSSLLDIRILQLSRGRMGLRETLLRLSKEYGVKRPFSEDGFFDHLAAITYPQIADFINRYIKGSEKLPVREYFDWLGITYRETGELDSTGSSLAIGLHPDEGHNVVAFVYDDSRSGLIRGDVIEKYEGSPVTFDSGAVFLKQLTAMKPGSTVTLTVNRGGKEMNIAAILVPRVKARHVFTVNPDATVEQKALRDAWMKNM